jgi:hypothetical protein
MTTVRPSACSAAAVENGPSRQQELPAKLHKLARLNGPEHGEVR